MVCPLCELEFALSQATRNTGELENLINALLRGEAQNARLGAIADEHLHARVRVDIWRVRSPDWMAERRQRRSGVDLIRGASRSDLPESNPDPVESILAEIA